MSTVVRVPKLPFSESSAQVGHWYKAHRGELVARGELLVELIVQSERIPIVAPHAGILEKIFVSTGETAKVSEPLVLLQTNLPNLVWDEQEQALIADTYRAQGVTTSMEYELRQLIRLGEGKLGKGFGTALALPQIRTAPEEGMGYGAEMAAQRHFKTNPLLAESSQFAGDFKDPRVTTVPSNPEAQQAPQNAPTLAAQPQPGPSAPAPKPSGT